MRSLRTKITLLNVLAISVALIAATAITSISVAAYGHESSENALRLTCETAKNNINYYLKSVEQSVNTVSALIDDNLDSFTDEEFTTKFHNHIANARTAFKEAAEHSNGVLTYYYRIDPSISATTEEKGFWYTNLDGKGFEEHEVTDLSDDHFECIWFYRPKETGKPLWLPPYVTDNLDVYVVSYNVPVYREGSFIGVVGIEIDYATLGKQINTIKVHNSGYAFIVESQGATIIYHPKIDLLSIPEAERPATPPEFIAGMKAGQSHIEYKFEGVDKHCYWMPLSNDMNVVVTVSLSEVNETWIAVLLRIAAVAAVLIALFVLITVLFTRRFTKPLKALTIAAEEINQGHYDVVLDYKGDDEIGVLTATTNKLIRNLGEYIEDLNSLAYGDALTSIQNKNAFDVKMKELQEKIENEEQPPQFAIGILDCDNLKDINDAYGHDKGDIYLRNSCRLMCRVFQNSPVYRIGGDEFAVILEDEDYKNRHTLKEQFAQRAAEIYSFAKEPWEKIRVSVGIASYDPKLDKTAQDVVIHADHLMFQNKRKRKKELK